MSLTPVRVAVVVHLTASVMIAGVAVLLLFAPRAELTPTQVETAPNPSFPIRCIEPSIVLDLAPRGHEKFGISCTRLSVPGDPYTNKRLFYDSFGRSNQTVVELDGRRFNFGDDYVNANYLKDPETHRRIRQMPIRAGKDERAWTSAIGYQVDNSKIEVTRTLKVFAGISGLFDTVLVRYTVKNTGDTGCTVALRTHLDTYLGTTDKVPFYVPPMHRQPGGLVDGRAVFEGEEIPDFVLARELDDLNDRNNTHAVLQVSTRDSVPPSKLILCHREAAANGPPESDDQPGVVIQWAKSNMQPKECRVFAYTYGLGRLELDDSPVANQQIALQFVNATADEPFPVIAHLGRGAENQTVRLKLPEGVEFMPGETAEKKLDATGGRNAATWRVLAKKSGPHTFEADAPGIGVARGTVAIRRNSASYCFIQKEPKP